MSNELKYFDKFILTNSYAIEFNVNLNCNLNCTQCISFAQYFNKNDNTSFEEFKKDFDYIKSLKDFEKLEILLFSNEPYVNKHFLEMLKYVRKYYNKRITVATNGLFFTYIPDNELKLLKDLDVEFNMTHYGKSNIDYRKIENRLNHFNIKHEVFKCNFQTYNADTIDYHVDAIIFEKPIKKKFTKICCPSHITIRSGKIYKCSDINPVFKLQKKFNLKDTIKEHIDYENLCSFKSIKEMQYFCLKMKHKGYCNYCVNTFGNEIHEWSNKRIPFENHLATKEQEEIYCESLE